jgi:hypothetical protein
MILVPETTSEPTSTFAPVSTRNGLTNIVNAVPPTRTATTLSGTAIRKMRTCRL